MNQNTTKRSRSRSDRSEKDIVAPVMSELELARLGGGEVAYIKVLSADDAKRMFPLIGDIPTGIDLFALHAADGTPIALTDTRQAALSHALEGDLAIASVH